MADPPRFEHGLQAPQAHVISRLHYGSSGSARCAIGLTPTVESMSGKMKSFPVELSSLQFTPSTYLDEEADLSWSQAMISQHVDRYSSEPQCHLRVHSGLSETYLRISRFNLSSLASRCLPMALYLSGEHFKAIWGDPETISLNEIFCEFQGRRVFQRGSASFFKFGPSLGRGVCVSMSRHAMNTKLYSQFYEAVSFSNNQHLFFKIEVR